MRVRARHARLRSQWPCCTLDMVRFWSLHPVASIPAGCDNRRMQTTDYCRQHLKFLGRRKSQVWDATDPDRIIPDFARADGLSHARAVAEALTQAAGESESSSVDVDALTSLLERDAKSLSVALTGLGARGKGRASGGRRGSRSGGRRGGGGGTSASVETQGASTASSEMAPSASSSSTAKLADARAFRDLVAAIEKRSLLLDKKATAADEADGTDEALFGRYFGGYLVSAEHLDGGKAFHGLGDDAFVVEKIVGKREVGFVVEYEVKWLGFRKTTWEQGAMQLQQHHIDAFAEACRDGKGEAVIYEADEALAPNANRSLDVCTMSMTEFVMNMTKRAAEPATCRTLKIAQAGEPPAGYLSTSAGLMVWATPCRSILLGMPMLNSETTTQAVYGLLRIMTKAPDIAARLDGICMDNACGLERHVAAKVIGRA